MPSLGADFAAQRVISQRKIQEDEAVEARKFANRKSSFIGGAFSVLCFAAF
jgi:hypothetical protein